MAAIIWKRRKGEETEDEEEEEDEEPLGAILEASYCRSLLDVSWSNIRVFLREIWALVGLCRGSLGTVFGPLRRILGPSWGHLGGHRSKKGGWKLVSPL